MKWKDKKDQYDALNINKGFYHFDEFDKYEIPILKREIIFDIPGLTPFNQKPDKTKFCHFFLDDYQFERVWKQPKRYINKMKQYKGTLTPDFSLYIDYPIALQIYNTYRNRWTGLYWQEQEITVIPTVSWSTPESFDFCFKGIPIRSTVAISDIGTLRHESSKKAFLEGYNEMLTVLKPEKIIFYGTVFPTYLDEEIIFFQNLNTKNAEMHKNERKKQ